MAVEFTALIGAVASITKLLSEADPLVGEIRDGWRADNTRARAELTERIEGVKANLRRAGELAVLAEAYARTNESVVELLGHCQRAERFLRENIEDFTDRNRPDYPLSWRMLEMNFDSIKASREAPQRALADRLRWHDSEDKALIGARLGDFALAHARAETLVGERAAHELLRAHRDMIDPLQTVETLLQSTMYDKILRTLQQLGSGEAP